MGKTLFRFDLTKLSASIRRELRAQPERRKAAMRDVAAFMEGEAKDGAPVDEGHLTESIRGEVQDAGRAAVVMVPANSPASQYAIPMHENSYTLGSNSQAKQAKLGKPVGKKYIQNARDNNLNTIREIIADKLKV